MPTICFLGAGSGFSKPRGQCFSRRACTGLLAAAPSFVVDSAPSPWNTIMPVVLA
jgi:hypothetical protein